MIGVGAKICSRSRIDRISRVCGIVTCLILRNSPAPPRFIQVAAITTEIIAMRGRPVPADWTHCETRR